MKNRMYNDSGKGIKTTSMFRKRYKPYPKKIGGYKKLSSRGRVLTPQGRYFLYAKKILKTISYTDGLYHVFDKCKRCGQRPFPEGYDACLGELPGVKYACCGHGIEPGYISFTNGVTIRGHFKVNKR